MARPQRPQPARPARPARPVKAAPAPVKKSKVKEILWVTGIIIVTCGVAACCAATADNSPSAQVDAATADTVVADLARASAAHGICYGWVLRDGTTVVSSGSNLGVGVAVNNNPAKCPKYQVVNGTYHWYPDSSESEDYATYTIDGNPSRLDAAGLDRLGVGTSELLDSPTTAILDAAEALPLLAQEAGVAEGAVPEPSLSGSPAPLESGGSDFWRARWVLMLVSGLLLLGALVTLFLGIRSSRRIKRGQETDPFATGAPAVPNPGLQQAPKP